MKTLSEIKKLVEEALRTPYENTVQYNIDVLNEIETFLWGNNLAPKTIPATPEEINDMEGALLWIKNKNSGVISYVDIGLSHRNQFNKSEYWLFNKNYKHWEDWSEK